MSDTAQARAKHASPQQRELPSGWRWVRLGEVCKQDRQIIESFSDEAGALTYFSLEHIEAETGRILRAPTEQVNDEGKSTTFCFDERHVLYGKLRPYLNKVALPNAPGRCTTEMIPLIPLDDTDREFLAWLLRRRETVDFAMQGKTGSRMPRADMNSLLKLSIPFPPLFEQRRIAGLLREQMAIVEKARVAVQARLEAVKALPAAFLRQVFPQPGQPLHVGWRLVQLGEVLKETRNGLYKPDTYYGTGTRILKMFNIGRLDGSWDLKRVDLIELTEDEERIYGLDEGDILFNRVNSNELVGKCAVIDSRTAGAVFESKNIRLRLNPIQADPFFVATFMNSQGGRNQIQQRLKQIVGQATVNRADLDSFEIPLPFLPEQQQIAEELREQMAAVEKARAVVEEELATINALTAALLRRAFNGEL